MKAVSEITAAMAASISGLIDVYCAFRSTNGMAAAVLDADIETIPRKPSGPFRRADEQRLRRACDGNQTLTPYGRSAIWPMTRAGFPATTAPAGTSRTTTEPAP